MWFIIKNYAKLLKYLLSIAISFSACVGFCLSHSFTLPSFFLLFFGVFFLSAGASAMNQYLEKDTDKLMRRTAARPIPMGIIKPISSLIAVFVCIAFGSILLSFLSYIALILGLINVIIYDFIYTPLKFKTNLATIQGGLVGAIPPLIGWFAAGEPSLNLGILFFSVFMFLWQIPHFMLLNYKYTDDYKAAGIATLFENVSTRKFKFILTVWIFCAMLVSCFFPLVGLISQSFKITVLIALNIVFIVLFLAFDFTKSGKHNIIIHIYLIAQFLLLIFGN